MRARATRLLSTATTHTQKPGTCEILSKSLINKFSSLLHYLNFIHQLEVEIFVDYFLVLPQLLLLAEILH